jgi:hypothetical protein
MDASFSFQIPNGPDEDILHGNDDFFGSECLLDTPRAPRSFQPALTLSELTPRVRMKTSSQPKLETTLLRNPSPVAVLSGYQAPPTASPIPSSDHDEAKPEEQPQSGGLILGETHSSKRIFSHEAVQPAEFSKASATAATSTQVSRTIARVPMQRKQGLARDKPVGLFT